MVVAVSSKALTCTGTFGVAMKLTRKRRMLESERTPNRTNRERYGKEGWGCSSWRICDSGSMTGPRIGRAKDRRVPSGFLLEFIILLRKINYQFCNLQVDSGCRQYAMKGPH
jgi:hypothetical protein